jgi:hypothetical protein
MQESQGSIIHLRSTDLSELNTILTEHLKANGGRTRPRTQPLPRPAGGSNGPSPIIRQADPKCPRAPLPARPIPSCSARATAAPAAGSVGARPGPPRVSTSATSDSVCQLQEDAFFALVDWELSQAEKFNGGEGVEVYHCSDCNLYRCVATPAGGFVQQRASSYLANGYWFYVCGQIPNGKDPARVDEKLIERYHIDLSRFARARRKRAGTANLQYLRDEHFFLLLATHGRHRFFEEEKTSIRDARRVPVKFACYSLGVYGGSVRVAIERGEHQRLKAYFLDLATRRSAEQLEAELGSLPFEPYGPVRSQLLCILRAMNQRRKVAGYQPVSKWCFRFKRNIYRPFAGA